MGSNWLSKKDYSLYNALDSAFSTRPFAMNNEFGISAYAPRRFDMTEADQRSFERLLSAGLIERTNKCWESLKGKGFQLVR